jgi:hypothetical protein
VGARRGSSEGKSKRGRRKSECTGPVEVIDLNNLVKYKHLSFVWFARMAVAWVAGQDPFERLTDPINSIIDKAINETEALKLDEKRRVEILDDLKDNKPDNLSANEHFMRWEVKEYRRVFGGRGDNVKDCFYAIKYVIGLSMLGREVTKVYGKEYLLMEPHEYLRYLGPTEYRGFYSTIRDFVREYEKRRANKERNINEVAFMTTLAGLVINKLRKYGVDSYKIRRIIEDSGGSLVLYLVGKNGITPLNLTSLVDHILRLEWVFGLGLSRALAGLARGFAGPRRGGGGDVIDSMNTVGDAVFRYSITGDLGYIYNMIRTVTASEDYVEVRRLLFGGGDEGGD